MTNINQKDKEAAKRELIKRENRWIELKEELSIEINVIKEELKKEEERYEIQIKRLTEIINN